MKQLTSLFALLSLLFCLIVQADEFKEAADKLCSKMTSCIVEQMAAEEDLSPQIKEMAGAMAKKMCSSLYKLEAVAEQSKLQESAIACFKSAEKQICSSLQDGFQTPECRDFEKLAEQYSK